MADYSGKIASASAAIMAKGMPVVYVTVEKSDQYDPVTGTYPTVEKEYHTHAVRTMPTADDVQAGLFTVGRDVLLVAGGFLGEGKRPSTTGYFKFGGHRWDVGKVIIVAPARQDILYKLEVQDAGELE